MAQLPLSPMDTHLYWYHRPTDSFASPLSPRHNITPVYHQTSPCFPSQVYPNVHSAPTDPQKFHYPPQIQLPTPQPSRSRVPHPERFLGASCQWVFCNSSRRTPMLACGFSLAYVTLTSLSRLGLQTNMHRGLARPGLDRYIRSSNVRRLFDLFSFPASVTHNVISDTDKRSRITAHPRRVCGPTTSTMLRKLRMFESLSRSSYKARSWSATNSGSCFWSACLLPFSLCRISDLTPHSSFWACLIRP